MNQYGVHLANGSQDIARVISLGCHHHLALEMQADYLSHCPGERYLRLWLKASDDWLTMLSRVVTWHQLGYRHIIPWNEANLESPEMTYTGIGLKFSGLLTRLQPKGDMIIHWPALSPSHGYREHAAEWLPAASAADIVDVHAYGSAAQILEIVDWYHSVLPDKELLLTECNPGAGNTFDQGWWAAEYLALTRALLDRPWVIAAIGFIWQWHTPDMRLPTTVDWIDQPIEQAVRAAVKPERRPNHSNNSNSSGGGNVDIALAIFPALQAYNRYVKYGSDEWSATAWQADRMVECARAKGINARVFHRPSDTASSTAQLVAQQDEGHAWLSQQPQSKKAAINIHTDSGDFSHTFGIFAPRTGADSQRLADVLSRKVQAVLGTADHRVFSQLGTTDYDTYIFATHAKSPACLIELCSHQHERDLDALWAAGSGLAMAMVDGVIEWAAPAVTDWRAEAERLRRELETATATIAERNAAIENYRAYLANIGRLAQTGLQKG